MPISDGSEKWISFDKIHHLQISKKKSTNSDNKEHETNLNNTPNDTEKERCQEPELVEHQVPEENIEGEILLSENKEQKLQAELTKLD